MSEPSPHSEVEPSSARDRDAYEAGRGLAAEVVDRYESSDPRELAAEAGVAVHVDEWDGMDGLVMLGTYDGEAITCYSTQIAAYARDRGVDRDVLTEAVVAHELGHHFVATLGPRSDSSARPYGLVSRLLARCRGPRDAKPAREAAANGFAIGVLDRHRPDSPVLTDPTLLTDLAGSEQ